MWERIEGFGDALAPAGAADDDGAVGDRADPGALFVEESECAGGD